MRQHKSEVAVASNQNGTGNLEHMKNLEGYAELRDVARRYDDDRGRRYCDLFGRVTGDINITYAYPGVTTAWHAHNRQYDEWFVIKGAIKVGLAIRNGDGSFRWQFISLSEFDGKTGVRLRFSLVSDQLVHADGWHIDDVMVQTGRTQ